MPNAAHHPISIRLPVDYYERLEELRANTEEAAGVPVTRTVIVLRALTLGIDAAHAELQQARGQAAQGGQGES